MQTHTQAHTYTCNAYTGLLGSYTVQTTDTNTPRTNERAHTTVAIVADKRRGARVVVSASYASNRLVWSGIRRFNWMATMSVCKGILWQQHAHTSLDSKIDFHWFRDEIIQITPEIATSASTPNASAQEHSAKNWNVCLDIVRACVCVYGRFTHIHYMSD